MATFQLKDGFGLNESITPGNSALSKYFQNLPDFTVADIDLAQLALEDLTNPSVTSLQGGVNFSKPIALGTSGIDLTVAARARAHLAIFVPATNGAPLFNPDVFGDNIKVPAQQRYVSLSLIAEVNDGLSASRGDLKFGFNAKTSATLAYHRQFTAGTSVLTAVTSTIAGFVIPAALDDIATMPAGSVATVESTGELKFSGSVNVLAVTSPLAAATLPALGPLGVTSGVAVAVAADYEFSGDYQMRVQRLAGNTFRLGFYRKKSSQFDFTVTARSSLSVKLGQNDLFVQLMRSISADASADLKTLDTSGLSSDQSKALQTALKSAIDRTLQIGVSLELSRTAESEAMFLYEVDLDLIQPATRTAVNAALRGDLSALVSADTAPPPGVRVVKALISSKKTLQHSLKINLLGIYNVLSLSQLIIEGTQAWDANSGALILTDSITASKINAIAVNLQIVNSDKLRHILMEQFLITVTYRAAAGVVGSPEIKGSQSFFQLEHNPGKVRMRDFLFLAVSLRLQNSAAASAVLSGIDDFGRTTLYAEAQYDAAACRALFVDGKGELLPYSAYTQAGRTAILNLVQPGDDDDFRLHLATNDALFNTFQKIGSVQSAEFEIACTSAGIPRQSVQAVGADYLNVVWFADAMQDAGKKLQALDRFLSANPQADPNNHDFLKLKQQLADSIGKAARKSNIDFGGPWGFETFAALAKFSSAKWLIVNRFLTRSLP